MPRILVVTGLVDSGKSTELWPKPDSQCTLTDCPLDGFGAIGFWTAQGPAVCGGYEGGNKCFLFKENQWMPWTNMGTARTSASAIQINPNQALIIGGWDENINDLKGDGDDLKTTTELISSSGSEEQNQFPVTIYGHCSFPINSTHAMVTAGIQDRKFSAKTWFVDLTTTAVTPGPTMKTGRTYHGCSSVQHGTKSFGIVAGGYGQDSTEMLDLDQESPTWTEGMQDKSKIVYLYLKSSFS